MMNLSLAEDLAVISFERYPGDVEAVGLRVATKGDGDRISSRNPRWQAYVVIGSARAGHQPIHMFDQYSGAAWLDRTDRIGLSRIGLSRRPDTRNSNREPGDPYAKHNRPAY